MPLAAIIIHAGRRDLIADVWRPVIPAAGAALAYGTAAALGGSGFIAAFVAGMTFGWHEQHPDDMAPPLESAPAEVTRVRGPAASS